MFEKGLLRITGFGCRPLPTVILNILVIELIGAGLNQVEVLDRVHEGDDVLSFIGFDGGEEIGQYLAVFYFIAINQMVVILTKRNEIALGSSGSGQKQDEDQSRNN